MLEGKFPVEVPADFNNWEGEIVCAMFSAWDTAGEEGYARIKTLGYPNTDMFFFIFSVVNRPSFVNTLDRWYVEIRHHCPRVPLLLVGTKSDLRGKGKEEITREEIDARVLELGAIGYVECSAMYGTGLREIIDTAISYLERNIPEKKQKKKQNCSVM